MADVFISYKSERRPAISHLARVIENHGYSVWFDYALMPGGSFSAQIERELRAARAVIVVWCSMSAHSVEGKTNWVVEEADLAKQLGTYLPVWLEPVDLPLGFRMGDVIDIAGWNGDPRSHDLDRLIEQISIKVQRDPAINYKALVAQSAEVWRSGLTNLAAYPLDKQGAQLASRNREREQREKAEAEQIAESARREAEAQLAAQQALADAQARVEAEQRLKEEQETAEALAKAEQARLEQLAEEERERKAIEEAAAKLREEQRLKDEAEAAQKAEEERLEAERLERERLEEELRQEEAERQRLEELQRQQEEQRAARAAAREERERAINVRIGTARTMLAAHRFKVVGALGVVGAGALAGVLMPQGQQPADETSVVVTAPTGASDPEKATADPASALRALTGTWTLESIPCSDANAENGRQQLAWSPGGGWKINGESVKGGDTPNPAGWFEIEGLFWRVEGKKLQLSVTGGIDKSPTSFNRCAG